MNFKIVKVPYQTKKHQEVLIFRDFDFETETEVVKLKAYVLPDECFHEETVEFENEKAAQRFITDFSEEAAKEFVERWIM